MLTYKVSLWLEHLATYEQRISFVSKEIKTRAKRECVLDSDSPGGMKCLQMHDHS